MGENCIVCGDPQLVRKHQLEDQALMRIAEESVELLRTLRQSLAASKFGTSRANDVALASRMQNLQNALNKFNDIGTDHEMVRVTVARLMRIEDDLDSA